MRITFITTLQDSWGGSEVLWTRTARLALERGYAVQVIVYAQAGALHPELQYLEARVQSLIKLHNDLLPASFFSKIVTRIIKGFSAGELKSISRFSPDRIIVSQAHNYAAPFHPLLYQYLRTTGTPFYLVSQFNKEHECLNYPDIVKAREIFSRARKIFFVSRRNKEVAERQLARPIENAVFIDNPLNLSDISYVPYPEGSNINFASVARFDVNFKGQDILLQVLSQENWKGRNWRLNLYGSGPDLQYLKDLAVFYKLQDRVNFAGYVNSIREVWASNQLLLMPSTAEGKPLALEEAMVCGRIGVVSDVAGNAELVEDGINGYLATSFFPAPFADALERAWQNRLNWEEMGIKANAKMQTLLDFNPERTLLDKIIEC